ncbi:MAG TPA: pilin [Candidatus Saccharimonadales bacterium]|nr:pilin [Candidatus Saccharimonadales bacterium]
MIRSITKIAAGMIATLALVFGVSLVPALSASAQSNLETGVCSGVTATGAADCKDANGDGLQGLVRNILNILSWVIGVVSVVMIIIGGFRYIISSGDSGQVQSAKNTILYAIVGLVIVLFAQLIVRFVIGSATKANG